MARLRYLSISPLLFILPAHSETDYSHYAFANYLGSGLYRTAGQNATVANIPISFDLQRSETESLVLKTPVSMGFFNFTWRDLPEGEFPSSVGTLTVTPGLEYRIKTSDTHEFQTYADLGFGTNFTNSNDVIIYSAGMSSLLDFELGDSDPVWVNRIFFAGYSTLHDGSSETYSAVQSGVDIGTNLHFQLGGVDMEPRFFAAGYWYFDRLKFTTPFEEDVLVANSFEAGITLAFSKPIGWDLVNIDRFGISYRAGDGVEVWRLIFEFPL
ncbi:conserved hypothetical protein [Shewanella halifaxensis HAW-EB4]|uniref:Uncharacterized protein n=1 Tax=Shewanella halifaxensis (strain HAW-EB4) TaxID=458817 RepID=B0TL39_SHEHH|nr:hypothetical protein [Shewanella halifaxensis]ABZ77241.1 conserved hypothetical protein [Shewanella halifaxensis HAW-EB4]